MSGSRPGAQPRGVHAAARHPREPRRHRRVDRRLRPDGPGPAVDPRARAAGPEAPRAVVAHERRDHLHGLSRLLRRALRRSRRPGQHRGVGTLARWRGIGRGLDAERESGVHHPRRVVDRARRRPGVRARRRPVLRHPAGRGRRRVGPVRRAHL